MFIHFFLITDFNTETSRENKGNKKRTTFFIEKKKKTSIMVSTSNTNNYCPDGETEKYEIVYFYSSAPKLKNYLKRIPRELGRRLQSWTE